MLLLQIYVIVIVVIHLISFYINFNKVMQINTIWKYFQLEKIIINYKLLRYKNAEVCGNFLKVVTAREAV